MRLSLDQLKQIDVRVATALARHQGEVSLNGLTILAPDVAEALSQHGAGLSLRGLDEKNDPAVIRALAAIEGIALPDWFYTGVAGPAK